jgi:hypothetical protein
MATTNRNAADILGVTTNTKAGLFAEPLGVTATPVPPSRVRNAGQAPGQTPLQGGFSEKPKVPRA